MTKLSPTALAVWEAFNQDEAGVFVDYGDKLADALRAAADNDPNGLTTIEFNEGWSAAMDFVRTIAAELEGAS